MGKDWVSELLTIELGSRTRDSSVQNDMKDDYTRRANKSFEKAIKSTSLQLSDFLHKFLILMQFMNRTLVKN